MGIEEVALFTAALQFSQAVGAYLNKIKPPPTNVWAAAAVVVGQAIAKNAATAFAAGLTAATAEFQTKMQAEQQAQQTLASLPPIT